MKKYLYLLVALIAISMLNYSYSKAFTKEEIKKNLPKIHDYPTELFFSFTPSYTPSGATTPDSVKLFISSNVNTRIHIEIISKGKSLYKNSIVNDFAVFSFALSDLLPYSGVNPERDSLYQGAAVHVWSDYDLGCYAIIYNKNSSDGFLALTTRHLGKQYIVGSYVGSVDTASGKNATSYISIVGAYDRTKVMFTLGGNENTQSLNGLKSGESRTYSINKGDVLVIGSSGPNAEMTGSKIVASKPVGVISGNQIASIPDGSGTGGYITEMELPTNIWGKEYHITQFAERKKSSIIKVFTKEYDTQIFRDGALCGFIKSPGGTKGQGWLEFRSSKNGLPSVNVISGDKPIGITQFNTSHEDDSVQSSPFQMVLTPMAEYLPELLLCTPNVGISRNYLNICYHATDDGKIPDDLQLGVVTNGVVAWKKINSTDTLPGDEFYKSTYFGTKRYFAKTILLPGEGVYKLRANAFFAAYSYGYSDSSSYGFPASEAMGGYIIRDTFPPVPVWTMDCRGSVNPDKKTTVKDMPDDEDLRLNLGIIYMHTDYSFNYRFHYDDFMPGDDRETVWWAEVIDKSKDARAVITFTDRAGNDTTLTINYYSNKITIRPDKLDLGLIAKDSVVTKDFWLINDSKGSVSRVDTIKFSNKNQGFEITDVNGGGFKLPVILQPLDSIPFKVKFTAKLGGKHIDSIGVGDTCMIFYKVHVEATGDFVGVEDDLPDNLYLNIFPNPSDGNSIIEYRVPAGSNVALALYDIFGNRTEIPINANKIDGNNRVELNSSQLSSGIYHLVLRVGAEKIMKRFVVVR